MHLGTMAVTDRIVAVESEVDLIFENEMPLCTTRL